jgi:pyruvate ferredoxin oxidoreductase gamma subunit
MIEVRIHGRGGQGNVVAAYVLATAAFTEGWHAQAFPAFGAERRGAPVVAFVRLNNKQIRRRCQVAQPDYLIIQDEALLQVPGLIDGLKPEGGVLLNSNKEPGAFRHLMPENNIVTLPATQLAIQHLGRPVPNTALLSAFLKLTGLMPTSALGRALEQRFKGAILEKNIALIEAAGDSIEAGAWQETANA